MSNWDEENEWDDGSAAAPAPIPVASTSTVRNWYDEDVSEEEVEVVVKKTPALMKPSKARALALKAKEEAENQRQAERMLAREREMAELSIAKKKEMQQQMVEESDFQNTQDLFMGGAGKGAKVSVPEEDTIEGFKPKTDGDFKKLAGMVTDRCCLLNDNPRKTLRYINFTKDVMRGLCKDLGPDDAKDLSMFMGLLSNEKRDEFKKAKGIKKKTSKKVHVRVDRAADMRDDDFNDFADDFM